MGKFYWLKLKRDFFKRHDVKILMNKENGEKMVLFYLNMLCESVDHEGALRFSEDVPYDNEMLSSVTDTDLSIVEEAMKTLKKLGMVKIDEKGTIIMTGLESMLGSDSTWAEKKRQYREKKRIEEGQVEDKSRTSRGQKEDMSDKSKSKRLEIEKEIDIEDSENNKLFSSSSLTEEEEWKPKKEEVFSFAKEKQITFDPSIFFDHYEERKWMIGDSPIRDWRSLLLVWNRNAKKKRCNVKYMENEYTKEYLKEKEERDLKEFLESD